LYFAFYKENHHEYEKNPPYLKKSPGARVEGGSGAASLFLAEGAEISAAMTDDVIFPLSEDLKTR
jgi:hypothetical protein